MLLTKAFKWNYGVVVVLAATLSSCYMDEPVYGPRPGPAPGVHTPNNLYGPDASHVNPNARVAPKSPMSSAKQPASSKPAQVERPGPKQEAAPQLPVIE